MIYQTQGIACAEVAQSGDGADVACLDAFEFIAAVRKDTQQPAAALGFAEARIQERSALLERAGIHTHIDQTASLGMTHDFEGERGEWRIDGIHALHLFRCRQEVHDGIHQR